MKIRCAYCIDMHWKNLRAIGESERRLCSLDAWRECPYYTARERAALASWNRLSIAARLVPGAYQPAEATPGTTHTND